MKLLNKHNPKFIATGKSGQVYSRRAFSKHPVAMDFGIFMSRHSQCSTDRAFAIADAEIPASSSKLIRYGERGTDKCPIEGRSVSLFQGSFFLLLLLVHDFRFLHFPF